MKKLFFFIIIITVLSLVCNVWQYHLYSTIRKTTDTICRIDSFKYIEPTPVKTDTIKHIVALMRIDTCYKDKILCDTIHDSIKVIVPIAQSVYRDSAYTAYVSGYSASLDSIFVKQKTITITKTVTKFKRYGFGIQGGVGYTPKGFQPYIGVGFNYTLFP